MIETVAVYADQPRPGWRKLLNPIWWLKNGDSWAAPAINNGEPYLPGRPEWWRRVCWWFRNPAANFFEAVLGLRGCDYVVTGPAPVMETTLADLDPPQRGWKWAVISYRWLRLPFVSYAGSRWTFYCGWRPYIGALGLKINRAAVART